MFRANNSVADESNDIVRFRFIDVGEGDATLITTPGGKSILIDAGTTDMGMKKVMPLLNRLSADLELIIASHYDADHIGGIPMVIKGPDGILNTADDIIPKMGVLDRGAGDKIDTSDFSDYSIITAGLRYSLNSGDEFIIDGVRFLIIGQNGRFMDGKDIEIDTENENAHSISLLLTYNNIRYLTSGDLPGPNFPNQYEPYDLEGIVALDVGDIDILHVSHHGSHNSTAPEFVRRILPETAIISVGENDYGHPDEIVVKNLFEAEAVVYLTKGDWIEDKTGLNIANGDICIETNGDSSAIAKCQN